MTPRCASCKAPLAKRGDRCRACGWAVEYSGESRWRERQVLWGISLVMVGIVLAVAIAIAVAQLKLP